MVFHGSLHMVQPSVLQNFKFIKQRTNLSQSIQSCIVFLYLPQSDFVHSLFYEPPNMAILKMKFQGLVGNDQRSP